MFTTALQNLSRLLSHDSPELRALLATWIDYAGVGMRREKATHDLMLTDGTVLVGYYPNADSWFKTVETTTGPKRVDDAAVKLIRLNPVVDHAVASVSTLAAALEAGAVAAQSCVYRGTRKGTVTNVEAADSGTKSVVVVWDEPAFEVDEGVVTTVVGTHAQQEELLEMFDDQLLLVRAR